MVEERRSADTGAEGAGRPEKRTREVWKGKGREDGDKARQRENREMQQRSGGVDECVSPIVFTQFHPSNKSFKRRGD